MDDVNDDFRMFGCFNKLKKRRPCPSSADNKRATNWKTLLFINHSKKKKKSKAKEEEIHQSKPQPQQQQQEGAAESEQCFEGEEDDPLVWRIS